MINRIQNRFVCVYIYIYICVCVLCVVYMSYMYMCIYVCVYIMYSLCLSLSLSLSFSLCVSLSVSMFSCVSLSVSVSSLCLFLSCLSLSSGWASLPFFPLASSPSFWPSSRFLCFLLAFSRFSRLNGSFEFCRRHSDMCATQIMTQSKSLRTGFSSQCALDQGRISCFQNASQTA